MKKNLFYCYDLHKCELAIRSIHQFFVSLSFGKRNEKCIHSEMDKPKNKKNGKKTSKKLVRSTDKIRGFDKGRTYRRQNKFRNLMMLGFVRQGYT
jgi:hypothetical protein